MAKTKTVVKACALALAGTLGIAYVGASVACDTWDITKWATPKTEITRPAPDLTDSDYNGGAVISNGESYGISLMSARIAPEEYADYGISTQAETASVMTATFTPAATTNKAVTWTVSGGDGKVTVTPVSGNPLKATVVVSGAFGTPATITCTSQANTSLKATATVNYVKILNRATSSRFTAYSNASIKDGGVTLSFGDSNFTTGTVKPTKIVGEVTFEMKDALYQYLNARHSKVDCSVFVNWEFKSSNAYTTQAFSFEDLFSGASASEKASIYEDIASYYYGQENVTVGDIYIDITAVYYDDVLVYDYINQDDAGSLVCSQDYIIESFSDIVVTPKSVAVDKNSFVFGPNGFVK